jgi:hypothetical protein
MISRLSAREDLLACGPGDPGRELCDAVVQVLKDGVPDDPMTSQERSPHDGTRTDTSLDDPHGPPSSGAIPQNQVRCPRDQVTPYRLSSPETRRARLPSSRSASSTKLWSFVDTVPDVLPSIQPSRHHPALPLNDTLRCRDPSLSRNARRRRAQLAALSRLARTYLRGFRDFEPNNEAIKRRARAYITIQTTAAYSNPLKRSPPNPKSAEAAKTVATRAERRLPRAADLPSSVMVHQRCAEVCMYQHCSSRRCT